MSRDKWYRVIIGFTGLILIACNASTPNNPTSTSDGSESVISTPDSSENASDVSSSSTSSSDATTVTENKNVADKEGVRIFIDEQGLAIRGTDPVAYFTEGRPVAGKPDFSYTWNDATWQFASAEHRDQFAENPEQYAPQYGGFCAFAVSQGKTATTDPEAWKIVDGKLYLNYSRERQIMWEKDIPGNIQKADANWMKGIVTGG